MHLSEGLLPAAQALTWAALSTPFVVTNARRLKHEPTQRARFGVAAALAFAVTLFPVPIPGLGATSHMCATPLLGLLLGPTALALPMTLVLTVQALLFAHGGLTTLGANVFTLGIVGPWIAWSTARLLGRFHLGRGWVVGIACMLGSTSVYLMDALMLGWALQGARPFGHWVQVALLGFAPVQTPLLILEAFLSAGLVSALAKRRTDLVPAWLPAPHKVAPQVLAGLLFLLMSPLRAGELQGLDEKVLEASAIQAGRHPEPWIDLTEGEGGLALFMAGGLCAGFFLGRHWERLNRGTIADEPSRT